MLCTSGKNPNAWIKSDWLFYPFNMFGIILYLKNNKSLPFSFALPTRNLFIQTDIVKAWFTPHSRDRAGMRTGGEKDERHFKSEQG